MTGTETISRSLSLFLLYYPRMAHEIEEKAGKEAGLFVFRSLGEEALFKR